MKQSANVSGKYPELDRLVVLYNNSTSAARIWDVEITEYLELVEATPNRLVYHFKVENSHCNASGILHGGCVASLMDICSSLVISVRDSKHKWKMMGVSSDLSISFLRGIFAGQVIRLECEANRVGSNLANIHTKVYDSENRLCYSGSHTKFNVDSRI